ncbi:MAG: hypothetical protein O3B13_02535 [Planctomycetota bacterium]|nr:hypothetical protein [Planctomycetota bacterium]MDA1161958.1 hypothetical protein [Planctomycetota bacterium]
MRNLTALVIVPAALLVVIGCDLASIDPGGGAVSQTVVSMRSGIEEAPPIIIDDDQPVLTGAPGRITGRVVFDGARPALSPLMRKGASKVDAAICAASADIPDESLLVGENGGIANVFVYLPKAPKGATFDLDSSLALLDQNICIFKPHALVVWAGVEFELRNSDKAAHNVLASPASNSGFNENMAPGSVLKKSFRNSEGKPFPSECKIHPWMRYWTLVVDHPYVAVTDANGNFTIPNVPAGKHKFRVFHERGDLLERNIEVVVQPEADTKVEWKYAAAKFSL